MQLAIETSRRSGSIALLQGESVLEQVNLDAEQRTAATLAPQVAQILDSCRQANLKLDWISVSDGPGSFTGLRIGVTTAKTLSYALGLPLVPVDALAAIAASVFDAESNIDSLCVAVDAYRNQVFSGVFHRERLLPHLEHIPNGWNPHQENVTVMLRETWHQHVMKLPDEIGLAGDQKLFDGLDRRNFAGSCDAIGVGLLAVRAFQLNHTIDPLALVPRYLKLSAAEEKQQASA